MITILNPNSRTSNLQDRKGEHTLNFPQCYSNYNSKDSSCQACAFQKGCIEIPPPQEPEWCNPE
ncbi:MAG: hypothetical protein ACFFAS_04310 [Promethearchaeota archaeon]